jgi:selenocysteine-specific elongation factor
MEEIKHVIVGTAGHIDHGKSALVEALTGTHPDRLEEEKRRGITIDLGFAFLNLDGVRFGFVDVPGHEKFVRNMLAGVGGIDLVLFVIAADESIKPQTREHFDICRLLGISRGIVAITKSDKVSSEVLDTVRLETEEFVRDSFLEGAPVIAVSARSGAGIEELKHELHRSARALSSRDEKCHFRLPVDRAFAMKGFGTVATGTLVAGTLSVEDEVQLYPTQKRARVRGLHSGGKQVARAVAGQRTAANLAGIDITDVKRGMVLAAPGIFQPSSRLDASITLLPSARPLKNRARVHLHQGTAESVAEIIFLDGAAERSAGETTFVQLKLDMPVVVLLGDRVILRQLSPVVTIGGGRILDTRPARHRRNDAGVKSFLETLARGNREETLLALTEVSARGLTCTETVSRTGWIKSEIRTAASNLAQSGRLRIVGDLNSTDFALVSIPALAESLTAIREAIDALHAENPLLPGIPKQELRGRAGNARAEIFEAALEELLKSRAIVISGDLVQRAGREIALAPEETRAKELIEREFANAGLAVPSFAVVLAKLPVESRRAQRILQILLREKVLVKVADDLVFHQIALKNLRETLVKHRKERGPRLPIGTFKELTGVSRKYAIPLLEYLDREHLTRRVGDERVIL